MYTYVRYCYKKFIFYTYLQFNNFFSNLKLLIFVIYKLNYMEALLMDLTVEFDVDEGTQGQVKRSMRPLLLTLPFLQSII